MVARLHVALQGMNRSGMHWDPEGLAELGLADQQHAALEVDIGTRKPRGFRCAQSGRRNEAKQRPAARAAQTTGGA